MMGHLFRFLAFIFPLLLIAIEIQALPTQEKEAIIIEVDGDPQTHATYIEKHHPQIDVVTTYDRLFNGLALQIPPKQIADLASLDFIKTLHPVQHYETTTDSILTDQLLDTVLPADFNTTPYTGKGTKVGVIDTGIDYDHPDLRMNYQGGYDVVDLDDDPMETSKSEGVPTMHGTHVAGIIAGNGELKGVAPDAAIYAYRALGPGGMGTSIQVIAAMEQAIEDEVDIMNLSLGNSVNGPDYPTSIAVNRAVESGVAVVIASGNDGPDNWTVGSPGTATGALTVGASASPQTIPYLKTHKMKEAIPLQTMQGSTPWRLEQDYEIVAVHSKTQDVQGKIALVKRAEHSFYDLAKHAEQAGAIAVIIYNHEQGDLQGSIANGEEPIEIPVAGISGKAGKNIADQLEEERLYPKTHYEQTAKGIAPFSSRGPVTVNWQIKPDLVAPGTNILSTIPGGHYQELQGTSMAAPHVAGAIALVKEAQPAWTNDQIRGALKTTAAVLTGKDEQPIAPISQGVGEIQVHEAIETKTIIDDPQLVFGKISAYQETNKVMMKVENTTTEDQTYTFDMPKHQQGLTWKIPQSFTIAAGEQKEIPIELRVTTQQLKEDIHQGWLRLNQGEDQFNLPYLFINQEADSPKGMGFELMQDAFSEDTYRYKMYLAEAAKRIDVNLYDPDTLIYNRSLFQRTDVEAGLIQGEIKKREMGSPGHYKALITIESMNGELENHEVDLYIEGD